MIRSLQILLYSVIAVLVLSCTRNAITGRKQLSLFPESELQTQSVMTYHNFLSENKVIPPKTSKDAEMVKRVGNKIQQAITKYYTDKGMSDEIKDYSWEFNLVENNEINAWCMPGGKVVVYTGLLPVTQNETALAIVLGHEITHAVAHHGNERMSQLSVAQGIQIAGDVFTRDKEKANFVFKNVFAPTAQVGVLLPNSRKQEYEADHYGLIFAAMAGYDPREAITFWKRMADKAGKKQPEFLATHPSDDNRIKKLQSIMNEALGYYNAK